jgi:hypothetical protein
MDLREILEAAAMTTESYQRGLQTGLAMKQRTMETVLRAYDRALRDENLKIPTYLHAAVELMRREVESDASALAEIRIKRDRENPPMGPEHDRTTHGTALQSGS